MTLLVKRGGHAEKFDERKIYASCYAACVNCHHEKKNAEKICEKVMTDVKRWMNGKSHVTSSDIFKRVITILKKIDKEVAFMYETHRDVS